MKLRWKKEEKETGLRRICAPPRGSFLHDGKDRFATVSSFGHEREGNKWYWSAPSFPWMPLANTCRTPVATEAVSDVPQPDVAPVPAVVAVAAKKQHKKRSSAEL